MPRPVVNPVDIGADELSVPPADLAITQNSDGRTIVARGTNGVTYTIVVTNNGPSAVTNATLTDNLPGGLLSFVPTAWSCTASAGSSCTAPASIGDTRSGTVNCSVVVRRPIRSWAT